MRFRKDAKRCSMPAPAFYEIAFGIRALPDGRRRRTLAEGFLAIAGSMRVLSFDRKAALWLADENARLRRVGVAVGVLDAQIAAIAATRDHVLVTRNTRDFASYRELRVEMWWGNEPP